VFILSDKSRLTVLAVLLVVLK